MQKGFFICNNNWLRTIFKRKGREFANLWSDVVHPDKSWYNMSTLSRHALLKGRIGRMQTRHDSRTCLATTNLESRESSFSLHLTNLPSIFLRHQSNFWQLEIPMPTGHLRYRQILPLGNQWNSYLLVHAGLGLQLTQIASLAFALTTENSSLSCNRASMFCSEASGKLLLSSSKTWAHSVFPSGSGSPLRAAYNRFAEELVLSQL